MQPLMWKIENYLLTADRPGPIIKNVMQMVAERLMSLARSANAAVPTVSLSNLLLVLVLITTLVGVQT
jgi:hypothetical protein